MVKDQNTVLWLPFQKKWQLPRRRQLTFFTRFERTQLQQHRHKARAHH